MAALIGLPFDIFATICHFLAPFDVLALIQTCQTLYNDHKSSELFIWIDQLRTTTAVNQSFLTASCLRDMQIKDLKHAATAPFRMLRKLEEFSHRGTCLEYASRKMISFRDRDVTDLFLVPGGRHLILLSQKRIEVWDLSTNYHTPNPIKRRVSVDDDAAVKLLLRSVTQHSSPGKSALRIVTHSIREHASLYVVLVPEMRRTYQSLLQSVS
ncbi:hypothetical protein M413DRAFT_280952 [Hebeloma cylindrosporum]|uniref:F-box domain-containing protein n=1 Tax=Hebeloma cylindrosporum TaxID=76867 RepID=A0A0C2XGM9_HEBCY|nr:hypothetical protein M413DRAFT_280952 [Hebeloma cylindrosporum h7]